MLYDKQIVMILLIVLSSCAFSFIQFTNAQRLYGPNDDYYFYDQIRCPQHWLQYQQSCYRFIKSPLRSYNESRKICQTFSTIIGGSDLLSLNSPEEHGFIINQLNWLDPQHRKWYIGAYQQGPDYWVNADGSQLINMENAFLPLPRRYGDDYLVYDFDNNLLHWGLHPVRGDEPFVFICEANVADIQQLVDDDRTYTYGLEINDPKLIPRGPYFIQQPKEVTFDVSRRNMINNVVLSCLAGGYPTPTYQWFKEDYESDRIIAREINPLEDSRFTISGGMLIILNPEEKKDRATYHCKASNKFGTIISESVALNFGYIHEFVLKRAPESGDHNWGKVIYCDPPKFFGRVNYYWSRDYFPNLVEEDKRVFVSHDGGLYFSALETIDRGRYSCSVQADYSDTGKSGPFFNLMVNPHSSYEQLKFANTFPKIFTNPPIAGHEVRLECMAFGYPIPSYNWTRIRGNIPKSARYQSFNRVLLIPRVQIEDQGEYVCTIFNDKATIQKSVILNVQAEPNFTIPLADKHIDSKGDLVWLCEAFGIPEVNYTWWKNGRQLVRGYLPPEDEGRIRIQDNVMTISYLDAYKDAGMYQCRASNTLKTRYSSAQLRVLSFRPSFKKHPLEPETYAAEQGNVTIVCNPEAAPKPKFLWKKDGNIIGPGGHRRILENGNLVISPVSRDDEGVYTCSASNELGLDESRGRLIVLRGPRIVETLRPRIVTAVGQTFSLYCEASIEELLDIAYIWKHNGLLIRDFDIIHSNNRIVINGGHLVIINSTFPDAGEYECVVKSAVGKVSSKSIVIIEGPPGPPGGVQVGTLKKNFVVLYWTDGASHGRPILRYTVSGRTNWNDTWLNLTHAVYAKEIDRYTGRKKADIDLILTPWSTYEFRISSWNELGLGLPSAPSPRHSTPPDKPYIAPENVGGGGGKMGDLTITWTPLRPEQHNGPGIHYKIFWKQRENETEFQSRLLKEQGNIGKFVATDTPYYTEYVVKVQSINEIGQGPISSERIIYSAEQKPLVAPQLVVAFSYNSTALNVTWKPLENTREIVRGKLIGHRLKYWRSDNVEEDAIYYLSRTTRPWALIVGLQPDTYYFVEVMAYNGAGEGPESQYHKERTYKKAPQKPPSSVRIFGVNPSTVRVIWRYVQPSPDEEPLQGYKIRIWEVDQDISTANDTVIPVGGKLEAYINNLSPGKTYRMRVLAYSNGGDGRMSSPALTFQMGAPDVYGSGSSPTSETISIIFTIALATIIHALFQDT